MCRRRKPGGGFPSRAKLEQLQIELTICIMCEKNLYRMQENFDLELVEFREMTSKIRASKRTRSYMDSKTRNG